MSFCRGRRLYYRQRFILKPKRNVIQRKTKTQNCKRKQTKKRKTKISKMIQHQTTTTTEQIVDNRIRIIMIQRGDSDTENSDSDTE
jgi:hypothetical protein